MTATLKPICRFCGSDQGFDQMGRVETSAWRKIESVARREDGKLDVRHGSVETERYGSYYDRDFDADSYRCIECGREERKLEDLIGDPVMFEPGARVRCPDGLLGTVATVDFQRRTLTVENWHEEFKFSEVDVAVPTHV